MLDLIISAIAQGILWGILSLGLFISFRVLTIADMTTEGSFPLGAATCVVLIQNGVSPILATLIAMLAGSLAGLVTGFFITVCKLPSLLAGILTMTALLSVNLRVMKRPNLSLLNQKTVFDLLKDAHLPKYYDTILIGLVIVSVLIGLMYLFFETEFGQALIATGDNEKMAISLGIATKHMIVFGLMLSNALIALAGAVLAQQNGYADINAGLGTIVIALAAIIIGEVMFGEETFVGRLICIIFGSIVYRLLQVFILQLNVFNPNDFKLLSALLIALCLTIPELKQAVYHMSHRKRGK